MAKRHHSDGRHHMKSGLTEHHMEQRDGHMIANDHSKFANLPTEVKMTPYPMSPASLDFHMEDNLHGIDKQISGDNSKRKSDFAPHKY